MSQRTLYDYFTSAPRPLIVGLSFLDLPYHIRRHIYILAGLVRFCPIDMNLESTDKENLRSSRGRGKCYYPAKLFYHDLPHEWHEEDFDCQCPALPHQLLYVCRSISEECIRVLYSENMFKICRSRYQALSPLFNLRSKTTGWLTSLCIRLNTCSCFPGHNHKTQSRHGSEEQTKACQCHWTCKGGLQGRDKPLEGVSRNDKSVISDWKTLCSQMSKTIQPSRLRLALICDTADYAVALKIIEPLLDLNSLQSCSIRLGQAPCHALRRLAENTVNQMTGNAVAGNVTSQLPVSHYRTQLAVEILQQILIHTDLIAPHILQWSPEHHVMTFDCCRRCSDALEVCCCPLQHAAFSRSCRCWKFPDSLFLIPRLRDEATRIFFRGNDFAILPQERQFTGMDACLPYADTCPPLLSFLTSLPVQALQYLRYIECVFPVFSGAAFPPGGHEHSLWNDTITFIAQNLSISNLTLTLAMSGQRELNADFAYTSVHEMLDLEVAMWAAYQRVVEPLVALKGLGDFFVHISFPVDETKRHIRDEQEFMLERQVMGVMYDSVAQGKFAKRRPWSNGARKGNAAQ